MGSDNESEHSLIITELVVSEDEPLSPVNKISSSSSSSSLSSSATSSSGSSFGDDFIQIDENSVIKPQEKTVPSPPKPADLASKEVETEVPREVSSNNAENPSSSVSEKVLSEAPTISGESELSSPRSDRIPNEHHSNSGDSDPVSPRSHRIPNEPHSNSGDSDPGSPRSHRIPIVVHPSSGESGPASPRSGRIPIVVLPPSSGESDLDSPRSSHTPLSPGSGGVMISPPVQLMERSNEHSKYRIPSSVFAISKTASPMEWSVASNESLFSIHVGNNSFSRDHIFLMGRSGELGKSGELMSPNTPDEEYVFSNTPPSPRGKEPEKKSLDSREALGVDEAAAETMEEVLRAATNDHNKAKVQPAARTSSHHSDGSGASIHSFAFPIKKRRSRRCCNSSSSCRECCDCTRPSCSCFKCNPKCCHCTWPSCSCSNCCRPCSHCSCPSCNCFKCCQPSCNCSSCCRNCSICKWPSWKCFNCCWSCSDCSCPSCNCCNCFRSCSLCKCPSVSCFNCCQCTWLSCFSSKCWRSCCHCKWPSCSCNCIRACFHCFRCKRGCKLCNC